MSFIELEASRDGKPIYLNTGFVEVKNEYTFMKYHFDNREVLK